MSQRTKVVGTRSFIVWLLIIIAVVMVAALAVGGLVVYPRLQEQRAEQARLAQAEQHYQAGVAFQNVSDWEAAEAEFKQVIALDASYKDVQARLVEVKTRLAESRATATATAVETHYQKALAHINLEQWIEAQMELQAVFETDPNYKDVQAQLAVVNAEISKLTPTATPSPSVTPTPRHTPTPKLTSTPPSTPTRTSTVGEILCELIIPYERCIPTTLVVRPRGLPQLTGENMPGWSNDVADPVVLYLDGVLHLWFGGYAESDDKWAIGYANSTDGQSWQVHNTPVLQGTGESSWDSHGVAGPSVLAKDGLFFMWYHGFDKDWVSSIGLTTSVDGIHWTPSTSNPVLRPNSSVMWKSRFVRDPSVIYTDQRFVMYYAGGDNANVWISYASSDDGISWNEYPSNPILHLGAKQSWEAEAVYTPDVLLTMGTYHMWYTGKTGDNRKIGHATSADGLLWVKDPANPVLGLGATDGFASTGVAHPAMLINADGYHLWYAGTTEEYQDSIGYAFSDDGIGWVR